MRTYVFKTKRPRTDDFQCEVDGEDYLARTVYESDELIDTGVVDKDGEPIMAKRKKQIGFMHFK